MKILSEKEIRDGTRRLRKMLAANFPGVSTQYIEEALRFGPVATLLTATRKERGMDLKTAAKMLRIPQYRLRYIEHSDLGNLKPSDLRAYIEFLDLTDWFLEWSKANPKLAAQLAKAPVRVKPSRPNSMVRGKAGTCGGKMKGKGK